MEEGEAKRYTWKIQVEKKIMKVVLSRAVLCRSRWIVRVNHIATRLR